MEEDGRRCHVQPDHCALSLIAPPLARAQARRVGPDHPLSIMLGQS
jgi:hypothetical protein